MIPAAIVGPESVAVVTGAATLAAVLVLGAAGRSGPRPRSIPRPDGPPEDAGQPAQAPSERTRRAVRLGLLAALAAGGWVAAGPLGGAVAAASAVLLRHRRRAKVELERRHAIDAALPDAVELLVLSIHAGRSPTQAVTELAARAPPQVRPGFDAVERRLHRGQGLADALSELPAVLGSGARELAATIASADREGLPLTPMLERLAADARAARRRHGEAAARRLPVRLSFPLVACVLPAFVLLALAPAVLGALSTLRVSTP